MGLGKTIQCIAFLCHLYEMKVKGPFFVVAPLSTLKNWHREFQRFAPFIPVMLYHGTKQERAEMRTRIMKEDKKLHGFMTVITSYAVVMNDRKHLAALPWKYVVVDEGHRLKNLNCRLIRDLKQYHSANRLLLTGTPLQNNLSELWSLLNFLLPDIFDDLSTFQRWFDFSATDSNMGDQIVAQEQEEKVLTKLHQILHPFLLRRLKSDVELGLPRKKELVLYAKLTPLQAEHYKQIMEKTFLLSRMEKEAPLPENRLKKQVSYKEISDTAFFRAVKKDPESLPEIIGVKRKADEPPKLVRRQTSEVNVTSSATWVHLSKCCNHPYLVEFPLDKNEDYLINEDLVRSSGKLQLLDQLLPALKKKGHKVLIFSQMTKLLDILGMYLDMRKHKYCRFDGATSLAERGRQIDEFNTNKDVFVFLLSTRAGGLGVNLTAADTVIIYDSDWNPQSDLQAQDRCHRIGQQKPVVIYRLIIRDTIDQRILERAESKRSLEKLVIHEGNFKGQSSLTKLTKEDMLELLEGCTSEITIGDNRISKAEMAKILDRSDQQLDGENFRTIKEESRSDQQL
eukprot:m.5941 g.5941  ORF g.5941 m.5941 type:complete len:567 (-) comp5724_c0_seq2:168-1868(-)